MKNSISGSRTTFQSWIDHHAEYLCQNRARVAHWDFPWLQSLDARRSIPEKEYIQHNAHHVSCLVAESELVAFPEPRRNIDFEGYERSITTASVAQHAHAVRRRYAPSEIVAIFAPGLYLLLSRSTGAERLMRIPLGRNPYQSRT
jgi:hypothetical protein